VSLPDFARGPGQPVNVPASAIGLPIQIDNSSNVNQVDLQFTYDPALLSVTGISLAADMPPDWTAFPNLSTPGQISITARGSALPAGVLNLLTIAANVPGSAPYTA